MSGVTVSPGSRTEDTPVIIRVLNFGINTVMNTQYFEKFSTLELSLTGALLNWVLHKLSPHCNQDAFVIVYKKKVVNSSQYR